MSNYYTFANHDKKERIEPDGVKGGDEKRGACAFGIPSQLFAFAMLYRWYGDRVVAECDRMYSDEETWKGYVDVTPEVVAEFNKERPPWLAAIECDGPA